MFKHKVLLILMVALVLAMSGCATIFPAATPTPAAQTATPAAPTAAPGTYTITTAGKNVKITGNGVVKTGTFKLPENWYSVKETYDGAEQLGHMNYFEFDLMNTADEKAYGSMIQEKATRIGHADLHYPMSMQSGTTDTFYLQTVEPTKGSWTVEFIAPPAESAVATAPKTFTGTGSAAVGPVKLPEATGTATISYNGPAGHFGVSFYQQDINYDVYPGFFMTYSDPNTNNYEGGKYLTSFERTVELNNYDPGLLLLLNVDAPAGGSWSITISPG